MTNIVETQQDKYERILGTIFRATDVDDYTIGVTTDVDDEYLSINVRIRRLLP